MNTFFQRMKIENIITECGKMIMTRKLDLSVIVSAFKAHIWLAHNNWFILFTFLFYPVNLAATNLPKLITVRKGAPHYLQNVRSKIHHTFTSNVNYNRQPSNYYGKRSNLCVLSTSRLLFFSTQFSFEYILIVSCVKNSWQHFYYWIHNYFE